MLTLENELLAVLDAILQAHGAADEAALALLTARKESLCAMLAALDPVMS